MTGYGSFIIGVQRTMAVAIIISRVTARKKLEHTTQIILLGPGSFGITIKKLIMDLMIRLLAST